MADKCSSWHGWRTRLSYSITGSIRRYARACARASHGRLWRHGQSWDWEFGKVVARSVITVKPSTVPAGWLRSRCQITNIGENRRDRFPVQSKQAEHKVTNFADAASPCHRRAASSLDAEEVSGQYNERLNKLSWQFEKLPIFTACFDIFPTACMSRSRDLFLDNRSPSDVIFLT